MDYLLRDSYFTGASYGEFDLTRILRVIRPIENGIAFQHNGMHAIEDYVLSRYQMYMQVLFPPCNTCHGSSPAESSQARQGTLSKRQRFLCTNFPTPPAIL